MAEMTCRYKLKKHMQRKDKDGIGNCRLSLCNLPMTCRKLSGEVWMKSDPALGLSLQK